MITKKMLHAHIVFLNEHITRANNENHKLRRQLMRRSGRIRSGSPKKRKKNVILPADKAKKVHTELMEFPNQLQNAFRILYDPSVLTDPEMKAFVQQYLKAKARQIERLAALVGETTFPAGYNDNDEDEDDDDDE